MAGRICSASFIFSIGSRICGGEYMVLQIQIYSLFQPTFQVSQYTGRIHLYSCIPGIDSRPRPLFENFRPEELESPNLNPAYRHALLEFVSDWNNLRPIDRSKLLVKPLQLPLSIELCYLKENLNHNTGVCLQELVSCISVY